MCITIEEMYAMKEKYCKEILELEMKKAVVDEFIAFAELKTHFACEEEVAKETEEVETDGNY